ncbi:MAG: GGDEF domain-containing protein [Candidatus Hydrogenedentota bacterium]|nr:MAG: GGDEF domain-containing protein [Candidatus Hydrogenedentota bacterium]
MNTETKGMKRSAFLWLIVLGGGATVLARHHGTFPLAIALLVMLPLILLLEGFRCRENEAAAFAVISFLFLGATFFVGFKKQFFTSETFLGTAVTLFLLALSAFLPVFLFRVRAERLSRDLHERSMSERKRERDRLKERRTKLQERIRVLQQETEFIHNSFEMMKAIVSSLEPSALWEAVAEGPGRVWEVEETRLFIEGVKGEEWREIVARRGSRKQSVKLGTVKEIPNEGDSLEDGEIRLEMKGEGRKSGEVMCAFRYRKESKAVLILSGISEDEMMPRSSFEEKLSLLIREIALGIRKAELYLKIQELAIRDALTNLYVPWYFKQRLDEECKRATLYEREVPLIMIDIDHFKGVNDTYGHSTGDEVLKKVAEIIHASLREVDFVSRYGGEEFAVILPEIDFETAMMIAERLRSSVAQYDRFPTGRVTISVGVAAFPRHADSSEHLISAADAALYEAKKTGRNRVCSAVP